MQSCSLQRGVSWLEIFSKKVRNQKKTSLRLNGGYVFCFEIFFVCAKLSLGGKLRKKQLLGGFV